MGWKIGQAIGRQQDGVLEPVVVDVRFGRQGLCTKEEKKKLNLGVSARPTAAKKTHPVTNINGKVDFEVLFQIFLLYVEMLFKALFDNVGKLNLKKCY